MRRVVWCVVGTRPEAIKLAPLVARLRREGNRLDTHLIATGQHRELLNRALADFELHADCDLDLMKPGQSLADVLAAGVAGLDRLIADDHPDLIIGQGDTTSVLAAATASFYRRTPFAHVEAGLRTGDRNAPFPEEMNRVLIGRLATLHLAPTHQAVENLLREGVARSSIVLTGNTVVDAIWSLDARSKQLPIEPPTESYVLVTAHRREHQGEHLDRICSALVELTRRRVDLSVILPVHPNPAVRGALTDRLRDRERILLIDPVGYADFVALMRGSRLIVTDSGGVQEEAPAIGKRVLVIRERTERGEGFGTGLVRLVGCDRDALIAAVDALWDRPEETSGRIGPGRFANPYGDGWASERITRSVLNLLGIEPEPAPAGFHETWDERRGDPGVIWDDRPAYVDSVDVSGVESAVSAGVTGTSDRRGNRGVSFIRPV